VSAEIRSAIEAGKEVSFHESRIDAHGWSGYGYIIVDPETRAGAYLIEGQGNGGWFSLVALAAAALFLLLGVISNLIIGGLLLPIALLPYYTLAIATLALLSVLLADINEGFDYDCNGISTCDSADYIVMIVAAVASMALLASGRFVLFVEFMKGKYAPYP